MAVGDPTMYKGYLGGHNWITHTDYDTLSYLKTKFDIKTMLDIGCGPGGQIRVAQSLDIDAVGIDGDSRVIQENSDLTIYECDYTKTTIDTGNYDLGWSCEFVEHVAEQYVDNFMKTFALCKYVCMSFAPPGTPGNHHVNCRPAEYWISVFKKYGLEYNEEITSEIRKISGMKRDFIRNNGLFFEKK
jgi:hypothetical protein